MTQPPDDHLKTLWQGQETETRAMSVDAIRTRAARYTTRRRWVYLFGVALMLAEIAMFGRYALIAPSIGARIGLLAILVGLGWMIARFSLLAPRRFPDASASGESILEFHRTELQRNRETFGGLLVMVGPVLLGVVIFGVAGMTTGPHHSLMQGTPLFGLMALWLVAAWWIARRGERKRQRRLAEIEATRVDE